MSFDALLEAARDDEVFVDVDEDEPTALIFTSGTTALPKGVELTYLNLSLYVVNTMSPADPDAPHEKTLVSVTIAHVAGLTAILSSIWGGRTLVILPQFDPEPWLEAVQREQRHARLRRPDDAQAPHGLPLLRPLRPQLAAADHLRRRADALRGRLPRHRGLQLRPDERLRPDREHVVADLPGAGRPPPGRHRRRRTRKKLHRLRSVGRPMDDVDVAIMDTAGNRLPAGREGEICVQSARVMKEYLKAGGRHRRDDRRRLAAHRRRRLPGRGRLPVHHRAA